jgi:hypothetical protein
MEKIAFILNKKGEYTQALGYYIKSFNLKK